MVRFKNLVILCSACTVIQAQNVAEISSAYRGSDNSVVRKNALHQLSHPVRSNTQKGLTATPQASADDPQVLLLVREAFKDKNPTVVEQAIIEAGELKIFATGNDLKNLYASSAKNFGSYSERIECAIFTAAGKIGGENSKKILLDALKIDNGSYKSSILLDAFNQLNDSSVTSSLLAYADKLDKIVDKGKQRGDNPILYSGAFTSASKAREIASTLSNGKAGK